MEDDVDTLYSSLTYLQKYAIFQPFKLHFEEYDILENISTL